MTGIDDNTNNTELSENFSISANSQNPDNEKIKGISIELETLCAGIIARPNVDVLFLGDSNHNNLEIGEHLYDIKMLNQLHENGLDMIMVERDSAFVKEYLLEIAESYSEEDKIESLSEYSKSRRDAIDRFNAKMNWYKEAFGYGISIEGVDPQNVQSRNELILNLHSVKSDSINFNIYKQRMDADSVLNENILKLSNEFNKGLLVYGDGHGRRLGDHLLEDPRINIVKVSVYKDWKSYVTSLINLENFILKSDPKISKNAVHEHKDHSHFVYFLDLKAVLPIKEISTNILAHILNELEIDYQELVISEADSVLMNQRPKNQPLKVEP